VDKVFARFLEKFGNTADRLEVPSASIDRYKRKLPDLLLDYWAEHGWCGYGDGIFWLVNPEEYEGVVASWLEGTALHKRDTYHLIARGAFGDLYLWGENTGPSIKITSIFSRCSIRELEMTPQNMDRRVQNFLLTKDIEGNDFENMFKKAVKNLGKLNYDEMYGFVPAIMLGGSTTFDHLRKVKAVEHLMLLSQLAELEPYNFPNV